jgi:hypothetical protein
MSRLLRAACALAAASMLAACTSQSFDLLPAGQGPGSYDGLFSGDSSGDFTLRIRESGQLSGSGTLGAFDVELRGALRPDGRVIAFITERDSQRSGEFAGSRSGTQLSGTWRFDPTGDQVVQGDWAAALKP